MFRFEEINYLYGIILIPFFYLIKYVVSNRITKKWDILGNRRNLLQSMSTDATGMTYKIGFLSVVSALILIALANPQYGQKSEKVRSQNVDIYLALDVSRSMMASDILPSRLERAQIWIKQFTERMSSNRIGLISFAGEAYLQVPLTTDIASIQMVSSLINTQTVGTQGTSLESAISLASKSFKQKEGFHKVIVLISDGEDHEGEAIEAAKKAKESGITIFTVPIGTNEGASIPSTDPGNFGVQKDKDGKIILTKPNRELLYTIASESNGELIEIQSGEEGFLKMKKRFALLAKKELTYQSFNEYRSYFLVPLFAAFLFWLFDLIFIRKRK